MAAHRVDARVERGIAAETSVDGQRPRDERGRHRPLGREQGSKRERGRHLRAVEQREPLFRRKLEWREAGRGERLGAGEHAAVALCGAFADQDQSEMRKRRQIARGADRALRGKTRDHARIGELRERVDHFPAHAGMTARQRGDLERDDEPHDRVVEQRSCACCVRAHQRALQFTQAVGVDPRAREGPETRVHAVYDAIFRQHAADGGRRRIDRVPRGRIDDQRRRRGPHTTQDFEREASGAKRDFRHRSVLKARQAPRASFTGSHVIRCARPVTPAASG